METLTLEETLPPFSSPLSLAPNLPALLSLAARGQWLSLLDQISPLLSSPLLSLPHHHLIYLSLSSLSLHKLRRFSLLSSQLLSLSPSPSSPDPFSHPHLQFQSHPDTYPSLRGSMLPFSLRLLYADLPLRLGNRPQSLDRFYSLLSFTRSRPGPIWRRRESSVLSSLVSNHFLHREFDVSLALIRQIHNLSPSDPFVLSKMGYVQLQLGDLEGARATFDRVEGMRLEGAEFRNLVGRNRALGFVVAKDYGSAVRECEECVERDGGDVVAANNKALCLLYSRDLSDSIKQMEGTLERVPNLAVNETLVVNLCSMYELAYVQHGDVKRRLSDWIGRVAPDDFDSSCTRV